MLQQTRVAAVVGYYRRFVRRFPTLRSLARAREAEVLKYWAGLGYYSRARNLHRAAREIVAKHSGRFPRQMEAALALPGVGHYTAAAVLSIAYGQPFAVLDGNVARVLARLLAIRGDLRAPRRWQTLQRTAQDLLDARQPADWNQAMMELGAAVCTPRGPRCGACPVTRWCKARQEGVTEQIPAPRHKPATKQVRVTVEVLLDPRGHTLLVPSNGGAHDGLFSRMWQFPAQAPAAAKGARRIRLAPVRHTVTHREVTVAPHLLRVERLPQVPGARTPRLDGLDSLAVSSATRKIARRALEHIAQAEQRKEHA